MWQAIVYEVIYKNSAPNIICYGEIFINLERFYNRNQWSDSELSFENSSLQILRPRSHDQGTGFVLQPIVPVFLDDNAVDVTRWMVILTLNKCINAFQVIHLWNSFKPWRRKWPRYFMSATFWFSCYYANFQQLRQKYHPVISLEVNKTLKTLNGKEILVLNSFTN